MIDLSKISKKTFSGVMAAVLTTGVAAGRLSTPTPPPSSASPIAIRWLNDGEGKPTRYGVVIAVRSGKAQGAREIVCAADGAPRLDGTPEGTVFDNKNARAICEYVVATGKLVSDKIAELAPELVK